MLSIPNTAKNEPLSHFAIFGASFCVNEEIAAKANTPKEMGNKSSLASREIEVVSKFIPNPCAVAVFTFPALSKTPVKMGRAALKKSESCVIVSCTAKILGLIDSKSIIEKTVSDDISSSLECSSLNEILLITAIIKDIPKTRKKVDRNEAKPSVRASKKTS